MKSLPSIHKTLRDKIEAMDQEVTLLHFKWTYLMQMFGTEKNVATINATAPAAFRTIEDAMLMDIILSIMRLLDPPMSVGQMNLSLRGLLDDIPDPTLRQTIEDFEKRIRYEAKHIKVWRNKKLAHNDLLRHLKQGAPLPAIQIDSLTKTLSLIREAMNSLHGYFFDSSTFYDQCITEKDGNALLFYLRYGLSSFTEDMENKNMERIRRMRS